MCIYRYRQIIERTLGEEGSCMKLFVGKGRTKEWKVSDKKNILRNANEKREFFSLTFHLKI